ncbi:MAG: hypothetical protein V8Q88_11900 [Christensenellales bacterium]
MKITILTTFPEMFTPLHTSMLGRAEKAGILDIREVDIRAYSKTSTITRTMRPSAAARAW